MLVITTNNDRLNDTSNSHSTQSKASKHSWIHIIRCESSLNKRNGKQNKRNLNLADVLESLQQQLKSPKQHDEKQSKTKNLKNTIIKTDN